MPETPEQAARKTIDRHTIDAVLYSGFVAAALDKARAKERAGVVFTDEQREWLDRIAEHIATSLAIEPEGLELGWFAQHGSLGRAHALFGAQLQPLPAELNAQVAA